MKYGSQSFYSAVLKEMKYVGIISLILFLVFAWMAFALLIYFQFDFITMFLGNLIGGFFGIYLVIKLTRKADPKLSKLKTDMNRNYNQYKNQFLAYMISIIYLVIAAVLIIIKAEPTLAFNFTTLIGFAILTMLAIAFLFLGIGYTTAWIKVKR